MGTNDELTLKLWEAENISKSTESSKQPNFRLKNIISSQSRPLPDALLKPQPKDPPLPSLIDMGTGKGGLGGLGACSVKVYSTVSLLLV